MAEPRKAIRGFAAQSNNPAGHLMTVAATRRNATDTHLLYQVPDFPKRKISAEILTRAESGCIACHRPYRARRNAPERDASRASRVLHGPPTDHDDDGE